MGNRANTVMTVFGVLAALCGVIIVQLVVPNFEDVFVSFGADLPFVTRIFVDGRMFLWLLPLLVPAAALLVRIREPTDTRRGAVALVLGIAIAIGLPLICMLSMYFPIFGVYEVVG